MAKLFLSYAREDAAVAERLARGLERGGRHDVWWDRELLGGASFGTEIEQQLRECDAVVVIWSAESAQSPWVRDEAAIGREAGKLIPVTLGAVDPPIGFRQLHGIDIGPKGRASAAAIGKIERAVEHGCAKPDFVGKHSTEATGTAGSTRSWLVLAAGLVLLTVVIAGVYFWRHQHSTNLTVAIVPAARQPAIAADYASSIAADMAGFLSAQGNAASVLDSNDPKAGNATYRFTIGYSPQGQKADTSLSMAVNGQQGILWSQNWSGVDPRATDLKKQMSVGAARALLCAIEAGGGSTSLSAAQLKLYIVGCSRLYANDAASEELASVFSQIVGQRPDFAPGWENLAIVRSSIFRDYFDGLGVESSSLRDQAQHAIARGRELVPRSGKLLLAEAILANGDWRKKLSLLDDAIAVEPTQASFYVERSYALQSVGRMRDAISDAEKAIGLDPLSSAPAVARVNALMYTGQLSAAQEQIANAYKTWPDDVGLQGADLGLAMRYGDPRHGEVLVAKVLKGVSDEGMAPARKVLKAREYPTPSNIEDALSSWRQAMELTPTATTHFLLTLGTFGRFEEAFRLAADPKRRPFVEVQAFFRPEFAPLRADRRFMAVASQYGLTAYWKSSGNWPDFCSEEALQYNCKTEAAKYR